MRTIEMILPDVRRDIDNARPRPVFGVDLTEHLRHTNTRTAVVIEKCCTMLRTTGFKDKGDCDQASRRIIYINFASI